MLQSLFRGLAERLILPDVLKKVSLTCKLSQLDRKDESIQKRTYEVSFSIVYDLCVLKNEGKMTDFRKGKMTDFLVKNGCATFSKIG